MKFTNEDQEKAEIAIAVLCIFLFLLMCICSLGCSVSKSTHKGQLTIKTIKNEVKLNQPIKGYCYFC